MLFCLALSLKMRAKRSTGVNGAVMLATSRFNELVEMRISFTDFRVELLFR